ncbi:hypothetical protein [Parapedobacter sp. DT-150]|uniref:hypothetical protein n=1 Tax=Parapedobacter sp. DT-150 TaxID=3396162 RepID=UPI003F1CD9B6
MLHFLLFAAVFQIRDRYQQQLSTPSNASRKDWEIAIVANFHSHAFPFQVFAFTFAPHQCGNPVGTNAFSQHGIYGGRLLLPDFLYAGLLEGDDRETLKNRDERWDLILLGRAATTILFSVGLQRLPAQGRKPINYVAVGSPVLSLFMYLGWISL